MIEFRQRGSVSKGRWLLAGAAAGPDSTRLTAAEIAILETVANIAELKGVWCGEGSAVLPNHCRLVDGVARTRVRVARVLVERARGTVGVVVGSVVLIHHLMRSEGLIRVEHVACDPRRRVRRGVHPGGVRARAGGVHVVKQVRRLFVSRHEVILSVAACWADGQGQQGHRRDGNNKFHPKHSVLRLWFPIRCDFRRWSARGVGLRPTSAVCVIDSDFDGSKLIRLGRFSASGTRGSRAIDTSGKNRLGENRYLC